MEDDPPSGAVAGPTEAWLLQKNGPLQPKNFTPCILEEPDNQGSTCAIQIKRINSFPKDKNVHSSMEEAAHYIHKTISTHFQQLFSDYELCSQIPLVFK
jgi:hypothetical protein